MDKITPISEVRARLPQLVSSLAKHKRERVIVTRNGRAAAVLLSPEELETLEVMADKKLMVSLIRAEEDERKRRVLSHHDVFG